MRKCREPLGQMAQRLWVYREGQTWKNIVNYRIFLNAYKCIKWKEILKDSTMKTMMQAGKATLKWLKIIKFGLVVEWDSLRNSQGVVSTTGEQSREFNSTAPMKYLVNAKGVCRKHSYVKDVKYSMIVIITWATVHFFYQACNTKSSDLNLFQFIYSYDRSWEKCKNWCLLGLLSWIL